MKLEIVTPEGVAYQGDVVSVTLPGLKGSFAIFEGHAPLISALGTGKVIIKTSDQSREMSIAGGFVDVNANAINVCLEEILSGNEATEE